MTAVRLLGPGDAAVLDRVVEGVFDNPIDPRWRAEFFADPRHDLAVAIEGIWWSGWPRPCITSTPTSRPSCG